MSIISKPKDRISELTEKGFDLTNVKAMVGGTEPPISNWWLEDKPIGCVFLARAKPSAQQMKPSLELTEYGVFNKIEKCTLLLVKQPGQTIPIWVDTRAFSNGVEWIEDLRLNDPQIMSMHSQLKEEQENDVSDIRSVQSDGLSDDAGH